MRENNLQKERDREFTNNMELGNKRRHRVLQAARKEA